MHSAPLSDIAGEHEAEEDLPMVPPPGAPSIHSEDMEDVQTIAQSLQHSVLDAASRHSQDMLETLRLEREEMRRQLDEERIERDRRSAELAAIRDQREGDLMARIVQLEERLAATETAHEQTKADLEQERQLRITEETERREAERAEDRQRAEDAALQLGELTNVATETRDELARKREVSDERWTAKQTWQEQKDNDMAEMKGMLSNMQRMFEESELKREEERAAEAGKPSEFDIFLAHIIALLTSFVLKVSSPLLRSFVTRTRYCDNCSASLLKVCCSDWYSGLVLGPTNCCRTRFAC